MRTAIMWSLIATFAGGEVCPAGHDKDLSSKPRSQPTADVPKQQNLQLILELRDGSRLVGVPSVDRIQLHTSFARLEIPWKQLAAIEWNEDRETARLGFANGDSLQGVVQLDSIRMDTSFGKVSIPLTDLVRISIQPAAILRGLVLYCSFDRDEGAIVTDRSGNGNNGKVHGATWTPDGAVGGGMRFDGQGGIDLGDLSGVEGQYNLTWGAWVFPTGSNLQGIMGKTQAGDGLFHISCDSRSFTWCIYPIAQTEERFATYENGLQRNQWQHIMATYDGRQVKAYFNGIPVGRSGVFDRKPTNSNEVHAGIGDTAFGRGWRFQGGMDEVMIFGRVLSDAEIRELYDSQKRSVR